MADIVKAGFWYCQGSQQNFSNISTPVHFTHLYCAFASISRNFQVTIPPQYRDTFSSFTKDATNTNRDIKTLVSIGGVDSDPELFPSLVSKGANRKLFIQSSIDLARSCNFHGLDLCWPKHPIMQSDKTNLGQLLNEWHQAIEEEAIGNKKIRLLLTATVFYTPIIDNMTRYPIEAISANLDWINVRAYDFYVPRSSPARTGPPATLRNPTDLHISVDASIRAWIEARVLPNKLVLGLPFVGFEWLLTDPDNRHGLFAPANGVPPPANGDGHIFYRDIIARANVTPVHDGDYVTDYCYVVNHWIGYDGTETIKKKIRYARENGLRGYFGWHVCADEPNWTLSQTAFDEWDNPRQDDQ